MGKSVVLVAVYALSVCGCATSFIGSAYVSGGRAGCQSKCQSEGLEMSGMIFMGEYSDACVCSLPGAALRPSAAGVAAGAVGVVLQQRREQEERDRSR